MDALRPRDMFRFLRRQLSVCPCRFKVHISKASGSSPHWVPNLRIGSTALCCFIYRCGCAPFLSARWAAGLTISTTGVPPLLTVFSCQEICFWCSFECIDFAGAISGERGLRRCSANSESALNRTVWSSDRVRSLLRSP